MREQKMAIMTTWQLNWQPVEPVARCSLSVQLVQQPALCCVKFNSFYHLRLALRVHTLQACDGGMCMCTAKREQTSFCLGTYFVSISVLFASESWFIIFVFVIWWLLKFKVVAIFESQPVLRIKEWILILKKTKCEFWWVSFKFCSHSHWIAEF